MVKEVNAMPEGKVIMTDKAAVSSIEKMVFPILSELMVSVRKAVKANKIA
jgi:Na+-transporting methylmalonyl-CoA/oxaloacetate decarboxylase beta subunit